MTGASALPRQSETRVVDGGALPSGSIDFAGCDAVELNVWLHEHERPSSHRIDAWPDKVRAEVERHVEEVLRRYAPRPLRAVTMAVVPGARNQGFNAVLLLHIEKAQEQSR